jgi:hypothetical protein
MLLVTGADRSHGASLRQFLASVRRNEPHMSVVVYDLGLTPWQRWRIGARHPNQEWRRFAFDKYPAHFDIRVRAGEFAWKPVIVWELLQHATEPVCWMDAGNILLGPLTALRAAVRQSGFYSPRTPGTIADWTHPKMLAYFGVDANWARDKRNLSGGCVAFDPACEPARELARRWQEGALIRDCIAPEGSDRKNHRQDQALLAVLAYLTGIGPTSPTEYLGFLVQQDVDTVKTAIYRRLKRFLFPRGVPPVLKRALNLLRSRAG